MKTNELKKYHKNPRRLSEKQYKLLKRDLEELGDLSGIVHDVNSNEIIGGNQRISIFNEDDAEITITEEYNTPTKTGTIAKGYVKWHDEEFSYRKVSWTKKQCEKANIVANKAGGEFDFDILANQFEMEDLFDWGFEEWEFLGNEKIEENDKQEENKKSKIIIECNKLDRDDIIEFIELKLKETGFINIEIK